MISSILFLSNQRYGEFNQNIDGCNCYAGAFVYAEDLADKLVENILVRSWADNEWHKPTRGYCGKARTNQDSSYANTIKAYFKGE